MRNTQPGKNAQKRSTWTFNCSDPTLASTSMVNVRNLSSTPTWADLFGPNVLPLDFESMESWKPANRLETPLGGQEWQLVAAPSSSNLFCNPSTAPLRNLSSKATLQPHHEEKKWRTDNECMENIEKHIKTPSAQSGKHWTAWTATLSFVIAIFMCLHKKSMHSAEPRHLHRPQRAVAAGPGFLAETNLWRQEI